MCNAPPLPLPTLGLAPVGHTRAAPCQLEFRVLPTSSAHLSPQAGSLAWGSRKCWSGVGHLARLGMDSSFLSLPCTHPREGWVPHFSAPSSGPFLWEAGRLRFFRGRTLSSSTQACPSLGQAPPGTPELPQLQSKHPAELQDWGGAGRHHSCLSDCVHPWPTQGNGA